MWNARWIDGSATFTMVKSRTTMNCAIDRDRSSARPAAGVGRRSGSAAVTGRRAGSVAGLSSPLAC